MEAKEITIELTEKQIDALIEILRVEHERCFNEQAMNQSNSQLARVKILEDFMLVGELLSIFEFEKMEHF